MLTDPERERLRQIEQDLADEDPRLARLLSAPEAWQRAGHSRAWILVLVAVILAALALGLALAL